MKRMIVTVILLILQAVAASAIGEEYVPTAEWEPPVIDEEAVKETEPWLLVLKVAQGELGYVEGPHEDESKYGEWFGDMLLKNLTFQGLEDGQFKRGSRLFQLVISTV